MGKLRMGFDIGSSSLKIAIAGRGAVQIEQVRLPENLIDENGAIVLPHAFAQFLKQTRKDLGLPGGSAALCLPAGQAICRLVSMPKMTTEQLMMNLPYEFSDFIQGEAEQYYCDYAVCQPAEGEEEDSGIPMMAAVASKQRLAEYVQVFQKAGIRLKTILPQEMSLIHLAQAQGQGTGEYFFIDLGHQHTRVTAVWRDRVQATREIPLGGRNIDLAIAQETGTDAFLANTYKTTQFQNVQESPVVADICERVAVEIFKVINFYRFTNRSSNLEGVYLVGGGAALEPMRRAIAATLEAAPVETALYHPGTLLPGTEELAAEGVFAAGAMMGGGRK